MADLDKSFYINTGKDGLLADTSKDDVDNLVAKLKDQKKIVLFFHGGLVSKKAALTSAAILQEAYSAAGAHPVFFVWESDLIATLTHNLQEIDKEEIFKLLLKYLIQYTVGKLTDVAGGKATGQLVTPNDIEVAIELEKVEVREEPYANIKALPTLQPLNEAEQKNFEETLESDSDLRNEVVAIANSARPEDEQQETNSKGVLTQDRRSEKTLMSPEIVEEMKQDVAENAGKATFLSPTLIVHAAKILKRAVDRFLQRRDHGVYCTVVEEILREVYFANIGTVVWEMMKKETADTFENSGQPPERGGWYFLQKLGELIQDDSPPEVTLVAHSAGSIFVCHMLQYVHQQRKAGTSPLPDDFKFKNVIFLAPACDFVLFDKVLTDCRDLFENFRMFTLDEKGESGKPLVPLIPVLYTRSLLYFVSGLLERDPDDPQKGAYDRPLVGMQRYYLDTATYTSPEIVAVRNFINENERNVVWAKGNRGVGLTSSAEEHGGFAEEEDTLGSVAHIINKGWDQ
jgi:Alpha/beta hydrolase of unknown function (DUF900)